MKNNADYKITNNYMQKYWSLSRWRSGYQYRWKFCCRCGLNRYTRNTKDLVRKLKNVLLSYQQQYCIHNGNRLNTLNQDLRTS